MNLIPKEILMSHLQRSEGAEEVSLPIDFFRDLLYQAMPRTWVGLTEDEILEAWHCGGAGIEGAHFKVLYNYFEQKLREKNEN